MVANGPVQLSDSVLVTGEVPRQTPFEQIPPQFRLPADGAWAPDRLLGDQALVIGTDEGLVVVLACAHSGIVNMLAHAAFLTRGGPFRYLGYVVVLMAASLCTRR